MVCRYCDEGASGALSRLICQDCTHCAAHCTCTQGARVLTEGGRSDGPSGEAITIEVTLFPVRAGIDADKVAVQVLWCLENRTVFPYKVHRVRVPGSTYEYGPGELSTRFYQEYPTR